MAITIGVIALVALLLLRVPVAISIAIIGVVAVSLDLGVKVFSVTAQVMVDGVNSFILIAAPFFMLAGEVMNRGGITRRIFRFANSLVGWMPGGLAHVNVMASMLFAGMTGSAISDAVGLGSMEIAAMKEKGYDKELSAGITVASSIIGPIIPPSVPMVIYGALAGTSIGALFLSGVIPGLLMGVALMIAVVFYARKGKCPKEEPVSRAELFGSLWAALPSMMAPVIVVGGIYSGLFTPTEAAIVAVAYALFLSICYREMSISELVGAVQRVVIATGALFFIVAATALIGWAVARSGVMIDAALWLSSEIGNKSVLLFIIVIFYLFIGFFMEPVAAMILVVPILLPAVKFVGIDLVHFGLVTVLSLCLGLLTPPVGLALYAVAKIADLEIHLMIRAVMPFLIALLAVLMLVVFVPDVVLFLPRLLQ
jgi:tripartite ATP-independent transporter DctM subunit